MENKTVVGGGITMENYSSQQARAFLENYLKHASENAENIKEIKGNPQKLNVCWRFEVEGSPFFYDVHPGDIITLKLR